jgi:hypothetical protein
VAPWGSNSARGPQGPGAPDGRRARYNPVVQQERYLGLVAGPFRVALPIVAVRQILDVGGGTAPTDPRALGVEPIALASVLGAQQRRERQALLLFDGHPGPVLLTADELLGVLEPRALSGLPATVATRWPGLVRGTLRHKGLVLILDPQVLVGLVEVWRADNAKEPPGATAEVSGG